MLRKAQRIDVLRCSRNKQNLLSLEAFERAGQGRVEPGEKTGSGMDQDGWMEQRQSRTLVAQMQNCEVCRVHQSLAQHGVCLQLLLQDLGGGQKFP